MRNPSPYALEREREKRERKRKVIIQDILLLFLASRISEVFENYIFKRAFELKMILSVIISNKKAKIKFEFLNLDLIQILKSIQKSFFQKSYFLV